MFAVICIHSTFLLFLLIGYSRGLTVRQGRWQGRVSNHNYAGCQDQACALCDANAPPTADYAYSPTQRDF